MINLDEKTFLAADQFQWIVGERRKKERDGKQVSEWKNERYFSKLAAALNYYIDHSLESCDSLIEISEKLSDLKRQILDVLKIDDMIGTDHAELKTQVTL